MYPRTVIVSTTLPRFTNSLVHHALYARIVWPFASEIKVDDLVDRLKAVKEEHCKSYSLLIIDREQDCNYYNNCRCKPSYYAWDTCEGTDLEYNFHTQYRTRLAQEAEDRDRSTYEGLKKKFGEKHAIQS
jgi:hypothetical protein